MKDLTKYFIDLSKCTEEQRKHIFSLIGGKPDKNMSSYMGGNECLIFFDKWERHNRNNFYNRTELTYPEFIKLFDGGEDYPGSQYQPLFDHLNQEHGLILHESEMDEIIRIVGGLNSNQ